MNNWQPSASIETLKQRAHLLRLIREFFFARNVTEVDTPALMSHTVTDPYMTALSLSVCGQTGYLQTSPEYAMKRLLAAGSGDIYQLSKNYRADERGRKHQPEFTLLEWYRIGWDHHRLMAEVYELIAHISGIAQKEEFTYRDVFINTLKIDPLLISDEELRQLANLHFGPLPDDLFRDDYLSLLFAEKIEPDLGDDAIVFVYDFPASQSALARLLPENAQCAGRFECYARGVELANGFWELTGVDEQRKRFIADNEKRKLMGKEEINIDEAFLQALESGLPECSGVALGVERLLMLALNKEHINEVLSFPF